MKIKRLQILDRKPSAVWLHLECGHIVERTIEWRDCKDIDIFKERNIRCNLCAPRTKEFEKILRKEGLGDWRIKYNTGGGLCLHNHKEIWLNKYPSYIALFLHEVAHAKIDPKIDERMGDITGHHSIWADTYTYLINKYLIYDSPKHI